VEDFADKKYFQTLLKYRARISSKYGALAVCWTRMQSNDLLQGVYKDCFLFYNLVSFFTTAGWESQVLSRVLKDN
jgi:hypothetical protein